MDSPNERSRPRSTSSKVGWIANRKIKVCPQRTTARLKLRETCVAGCHDDLTRLDARAA